MFNKSTTSRLEDRSLAFTRTCGSTRRDSNVDFKTAPPVPQSIGRFEILRELGRGGFGTVFLAHDQVLKRNVALKLPMLTLEGRQEAKESLLREARAAAGLRHPNVVTIYDVGEDNGTLYVAMEHVEGGTLRDRIDQGPLSPVEAASIMAKVAEAVHQAHQQGLVHRDLKPGNILLTASGEPKVSDFGLMVYEDERVSQRGKISGTYPYMSPEQLSGKSTSVDGRSDIWSLGVILYECLTGRRPFLAKETEELIEEIMEGEVKPLRQINENIPAELEQLCLECLRKSPSERPSNAADVARILRRVANPPLRRRRWQRVVSALAGVVLLVLILLGWWLGRPRADGDSNFGNNPPPLRTDASQAPLDLGSFPAIPADVTRVSLLSYKPTPILFPKLVINAFHRVAASPDGGKVFLASTAIGHHGFVGFAHHQTGTFRTELQAQVPHQQRKYARTGIFWGFHLDRVAFSGNYAVPKFRLRAVTVARTDAFPNKLYLEVFQAELRERDSGGLFVKSTHTVQNALLPLPQNDQVALDVEIKDGTPVEIRYQGKIVPLRFRKEFVEQGKNFTQGVAGLYVITDGLVVACTKADLVFPQPEKE